VKEGNATLHEQLKMVKAKAATEGKDGGREGGIEGEKVA